jgi:hypothetical protein
MPYYPDDIFADNKNGERVLPGDSIHYQHGRWISRSFDSIGEAKETARKLSGVPGSWWKLQSPLERTEPEEGKGVVWALMYPEGHSKTGIVGFNIFWSRPKVSHDPQA